jgi:hypothetical protein
MDTLPDYKQFKLNYKNLHKSSRILEAIDTAQVYRDQVYHLSEDKDVRSKAIKYLVHAYNYACYRRKPEPCGGLSISICLFEVCLYFGCSCRSSLILKPGMMLTVIVCLLWLNYRVGIISRFDHKRLLEVGIYWYQWAYSLSWANSWHASDLSPSAIY